MAEKQTILIEIQAKTDRVDALKKSIAELKQENKLLQKQQRELDKLYAKGEISLKDYEKRTNNLSKILEENQEELKGQTQELKEVNRELKLNKKVTDSATGSVEQLKAQSALLTREYEQMSEAERENTERGRELTEQLTKINKAIAATKVEVEDGTDLWSRYTVGINNAVPALGGFNDTIKNVRGGFSNFSKGVRGTIKTLGGLKTAIIATGVGALILAITTLVGFLTKTEKGTRLVNKVLAGVGAVIKTLIGRVLTFGEGLYNIITGDFSKGIDKLTGSFDGLADAINENVDAAIALEKQSEFLKVLERNTATTIAKLNSLAETQGAIADDSTRSLKEREAAARNAEKASISAAQAELKLAQERNSQVAREFELASRTNSLNDEIRDKKNDAYIAEIEAQKNLTLAEEDAGKRRREIQRDLFEQQLDYTIDGFDNRKTTLERQLNDEKLNADERIAILNKIREEDKRNQQEIVNLYEEQTGKRIDLNALLAEDNIENLNKIVQENLAFDENESTRLLEVIRERRTFNQDILELEREVNERAAKEKDDFLKSIQGKEEEASIRSIEAEKAANQEKAKTLIKDKEELAAALAQIDKNYLEQKSEYEATEKEKTLEKEQEKLELLNEIRGVDAETQLENERERLIAEAELKIQDEEELQAALLAIDDKYTEDQKRINKAKNEAILGSTADMLGQIASLFGENTLASKIAASAQALINTYLGATAAFAQTPGGIIIKSAAASIAVASGLANVAKINGVKLNRGGKVPGGKYSDGDTIPAMLSPEEVVLTPAHQEALGGASTFASIGVPGFNQGGLVGGTTSFASNNVVRDAQKNVTVVEKQVPVIIYRDLTDVAEQQYTETLVETD